MQLRRLFLRLRTAVWEGSKPLSMSVISARRIGLPVLALLASCGGDLPGIAIPDNQAERYYSVPGAAAAAPISRVIRDRGIRPPDQASPVPLLEQVRRELAKSDPNGAFAGTTYDLTRGNRLAADWLVQNPTRWGRRASDLTFYPLDCKGCSPDVLLPICNSDTDCGNGGACRPIWPATADGPRRKVCLGHSDALLLPTHDLVASAQRFVDIAALQPVPDIRFLAALRAGLTKIAASGRPVTVRLLVGQYPPAGVDAAALLASLISDARGIPGSRLSVNVAAMRSCTAAEECRSFSWPHAKFIAVDGREALVGGHNLWSADYLIDSPVHDLSMLVKGPASASASRFADRLWRFVCANLGRKQSVQLATFPGSEGTPCPDALAPPSRDAESGQEVLAVARLGAGITTEFANQSDLARDLLFAAARKTIRISQQDLGFKLGRSNTLFPESTIERLLDFIEQRDGHVYIVLSNPGSIGNSGSPYDNGVTLLELARHLRGVMMSRLDARDRTARYAIAKGPDAINALLCSHVHLAPLRFGPDPSWPGGKAIANHAKFWMVDDRTFYVGSDNMYPVNLQEFGYILDDGKAATELLDSYWTPLWQWSQRAAVSGEGVEQCIFREVIK
jgi:phosphatidylserine/phosphatidylglycerophosphate/cardiolipin synthase-like enzyme